MTPDDALLPGLDMPSETVAFQPTRAAGLARLDQFAGRTGRHYAAQRNYDFGHDNRSNVSALSPWIRHQLITEEEVLRTTLARFAPSTTEKFIQEVFWRGYFKGWLEQRPSVWRAYLKGRDKALRQLQSDMTMQSSYENAIAGQAGIDGFDHWARELVATGYLHNHARMWFASIWIFTLRLPWELGADFFLQHLMDADPASNTLSWRWVAGLHTKGKTYTARAANISKYTSGRFRPLHQLAAITEPLQEAEEHALVPVPAPEILPEGEHVLLLTEDGGYTVPPLGHPPAAVIGLDCTALRAANVVGTPAKTFSQGALHDAMRRAGDAHGKILLPENASEGMIETARLAGASAIVTAYPPTGPAASLLRQIEPDLVKAGLTLCRVQRKYDQLVWPHATKGFFGLKKKIPKILGALALSETGAHSRGA